MAERSFIETWSLGFDEMAWVEGFSRESRVWAAFQLRFFRQHGRFPSRDGDLDEESLRYLTEQLGLSAPDLGDFHFGHVNARRQRAAILRHLGFRQASKRDREGLRIWLADGGGGSAGTVDEHVASGYRHCLEIGVFIPSDRIMERLVRGARHDFVEGLLTAIVSRLSTDVRAKLDGCLADPKAPTGFLSLKNDVGAASLKSILAACDRLTFTLELDLPDDLLAGIDPSWIRRLIRRVDGETAAEMRRHGTVRRLGLLALYLIDRRRKLIDSLIDLLLDIVHRMQTRSRRRVIGRIARDIERVYGKERLLVDIAMAAIDDPEGRVVDVIYPVAGAAKLKAVIEEGRAKGTLDRRIQTVMRGSYARHYRRMLPRLLSVLRFCSNNTRWQPILDALALIVRLGREGRRFVSAGLAPEGSIPDKWKDMVVDSSGRLNVISYELCVLAQLRDRVRSKEIWIVGADRYRNPDEDLPADFAVNRDSYYAGLGLTQDAQSFVANVRAELEDELYLLNRTLPGNDKVRLRCSGENRIRVTPFAEADEPPGLNALKGEVGRTWPMTGLLDVLKEAALDIGFLDGFETSARLSAENL
ncbi:MAG: DUF4158 domain-containing protein [Alphaproteobacteria bacterium GM202ARS2]|nr:DUF4158 domain-containing protein [Alphaproteobacteria bacterium GM202ARS2]